MPRCTYACNTADHAVSRRAFLGAAGAAAALGPAGVRHARRGGGTGEGAEARAGRSSCPAASASSKRWDPKPDTDTGGPFQAIPTSVPGTHICELLPHTAKQMHRMALVRGINTSDDDHGNGALHHAHRPQAGGRRSSTRTSAPSCAKLLGGEDSRLPGYIHDHCPAAAAGSASADAAFLGPQYASVSLGDGKPPAEPAPARRPDRDSPTPPARRSARSSTTASRKSPQVRRHRGLHRVVRPGRAAWSSRASVFDIEPREPARLADRYGQHDFGRHCLLARRLLEAGVTFVKVHALQLRHAPRELRLPHRAARRVRPALRHAARRPRRARHARQHAGHRDVASSAARRASTATTAATTGRRRGRSRWPAAASRAARCVGKTNANGTAVTDREVNGGPPVPHLPPAVGLDPTKNFYPNERPIPIADPKARAIKEVLA